MSGANADYVIIRQQPTALQTSPERMLAALDSALSGHGFAVQRGADMGGWLADHAAFVACIAAALQTCGADPARLAADRPVLRLMRQAITDALGDLRARGTAGRCRATWPSCIARCSSRSLSDTGRGRCGPPALSRALRVDQGSAPPRLASVLENVGQLPAGGRRGSWPVAESDDHLQVCW